MRTELLDAAMRHAVFAGQVGRRLAETRSLLERAVTADERFLEHWWQVLAALVEDHDEHIPVELKALAAQLDELAGIARLQLGDQGRPRSA